MSLISSSSAIVFQKHENWHNLGAPQDAMLDTNALHEKKMKKLRKNLIKKQTLKKTKIIEQKVTATKKRKLKLTEESTISKKLKVDVKSKVVQEQATRKKPRQSFLDKVADWDLVPQKALFGIPLFQNGNKCNPLLCDKVKILVKNSCAFDSLFQIITCGMAMRPNYREAINSVANNFIRLCENTL